MAVTRQTRQFPMPNEDGGGGGLVLASRKQSLPIHDIVCCRSYNYSTHWTDHDRDHLDHLDHNLPLRDVLQGLY